MIRKMFNLRCADGHYHYSPTPKVWIGRPCMKGLAGEGRAAQKCQATMALSSAPQP